MYYNLRNVGTLFIQQRGLTGGVSFVRRDIMRKLSTVRRIAGLMAVAALLIVGLFGAPAPAAGQGPEDRPTVQPPTPTPLPGLASAGLPSLQGTVINWGFRNEPDVTVRASGEDWHLDATSDATGYYLFESLGNDVIRLNLMPPKDSGYKPLTTDLAVRPVPGVETTVNLAFYAGEEALPLPVDHRMEASATEVLPGDKVTFTMQVRNNLEAPMTHVQFTDYLPQGLGFVRAESDHGPLTYADRLVVARLETLEPGEEATVTLVTLVEPLDGESWELVNRSSLFYRESVATQASVTLTVSDGSADELPVTGAGLPAVAVGLGALLVIARQLRTRTFKG
jgi:uncharacterized repeat protein (TIGR01451 family)